MVHENIFLALSHRRPASIHYTKNGDTLSKVDPRSNSRPGHWIRLIREKGNITGYGLVFVKFKVSAINTSKSSGTLDGHARTILENGTLLSSPLKGTWKRNGADVKFYFTDAINNGAMNFVMWDVSLLKKKAEVKYYELHSSDN